MKNNLILAIIISLLIGGSGGFLVGKNQAAGVRNNLAQIRNGQFNGITRNGATGQNRNTAFRPVVGEIVGIDQGSMTVKTEDGSTKIVLISDQTSYSQTSQVNKENLKVGDKIGAFGTSNSDGSLSAQNIQINPEFRISVGARNQGQMQAPQQ